MQYVNDDMDDIFRRAAENYPLDTSGADWNKVLAGIQGQDLKAEKKNDRRRYLWLLMLLPLGLVCNYYYDRGKSVTAEKLSQKNLNDNSAIVQQSPAGGPDPEVKNNGVDIVNTESKHSILLRSKVNPLAEDINVLNGTNKKKIPANSNDNKKNLVIGERDNQQFNSGTSNNVSNQVSTGRTELYSTTTSSYTSFIDPHKLTLTAAAIHPTGKYQDIPTDPVNKSRPERKSQKFYLGFMGGIDKTTIEGQKASQPGVDYGMLIGYKIGRKWSVEAGAFIDKKYYYTEGKYLKNDGIYLPPNSWITDVEGSCKMWDFSIGGSYSLFNNKKSSWFVATGMSSYIMKEEDYDYTYYYAGSGTSAVHSKTYYNESKDLFSIVNLSTGYTHRFGKITDLRVEPYLKIPVQGLGVGNLQMLSAGVHIGITGKLF